MTHTNLYSPNQLIKDAAKHGELVVFVGAGVSKLCGSPDWREFANQVVDELGAELTFLEAEQLRGLQDSRRTLSIAMGLAKEMRREIDFDNILHPKKPKSLGLELYDLLSNLRPVFVTTNYDKWLDAEMPSAPIISPTSERDSEPTQAPNVRSVYYLREHLTSDRLTDRGAVIHLHGSYLEPNSMVVSLRDYITHYADEGVLTFLREMFRNYTVLFIGYGLSEIEILEHIIRSNESATDPDTKESQHFILYACRTSEAAQTKFIERFFKHECGIQVIPYCIDEKGHGELVEVFRAWIPELDVRDPAILDLQRHIDRCVADGVTSSRRKSAIRSVLTKPELTEYFMNSLKDPVWFGDLDSAGFFDVKYSPAVKLIQDGGSRNYQAEGWPALRYLEHIAPLVTDERGVRIIEILRQVTNDAKNRNLDNWRTWWSLAIISAQLPLTVIREYDIELARIWLFSRFDASMVGRTLGTKLLPRLLESTDSTNWPKALILVEVLTTLRPAEIQ